VKSEEFIREVDEELQRERLSRLWRRYGALLVGLALLVVLATAAKVGWDHWRERARAAEALRFAQAEAMLTDGRPAEAAQAFAALAAEGDTGYAALARLKEAEAKLAAADAAGAADSLLQLAQNPERDPILRDLGALLAAAQELDRGDPAALTARLEPLTASGAPWRHSARELLALVAMRAGDVAKAKRLLEELTREADVPPSQERRAEELLQALGGPTPQASS
jgi:hypothetical protein